MTLLDGVLTALGTSGLLLVALRFLAGEWIVTRLRESVAAEYRRELEKFKGELAWETRRREQAAQVGSVLSLWMKMNYDPGLNPNALRHELQQKYWELALWLDASVLRELNKCVVGTGTPGLQHKVAMIGVRKLLVGKDDPVTAEELAHWNPVVAPKPAERPGR